jgi:hypothetical protein
MRQDVPTAAPVTVVPVSPVVVVTPVKPSIKVGVGSEAWWASRLSTLVTTFIGVVATIHPKWVKLSSAAQTAVIPAAFLASAASVGIWLAFSFAHHKLTVAEAVADAEREVIALTGAVATVHAVEPAKSLTLLDLREPPATESLPADFLTRAVQRA